jgi:DNA-binding GntR family transcriptional regulator
MAGTYSPNERLVEATLTRRLGVSRNSLRTVLASLQHEGLVVLEPNRGARVRSFSLDEARDILRVREAIEALIAGAGGDAGQPGADRADACHRRRRGASHRGGRRAALLGTERRVPRGAGGGG